MDEALQRRWKAHCERMAEATHALADWCDDPGMMAGYLELAARWIAMASGPAFDGDDGACLH